MGDSGSDSDAAEEEQGIAGELTQADVTTQPSRSNIVGSSSYDAQFTADNLEARGLDPSNFMSPSNFAQTTQGGAGGDDTTSTAEDFIDSTGISVPTIQTAGTTPTFSGAGVSDVFDPQTMESRFTPTPTFGAPNVTRETVVDNTPLGLARSMLQDVQGLKGTTSGLLDALNFGTGTGRGIDTETPTRSLDPSGIDFGVTDPTISTVGDDFGPALDMVDARTKDTSIVGDDFGPALDMVDSRTTATGTTTGDAQFGVSPGRLQAEFGPRVASLAGGLDAQKTADIADLTNRPGIGTTLGLPSFARGAANFIGQKSRDRMAEAIARGRTDPLFGKGIDITDANLIRNDRGQVVGIRDNFGNLIEGMDPNEQMQGDDSPDPQKIVPPKQPTDPCPEGFQLIDGKCTPVGGTETDTGFVVFPPGRDPSFQRGPFTPATVATNPGIRGLNPITFNIPQNIFRR